MSVNDQYLSNLVISNSHNIHVALNTNNIYQRWITITNPREWDLLDHLYIRHPSMQTDPDYCRAVSFILVDAAIVAVASSIWNKEIQGSQDTLCSPHSWLPQGHVLGHLERKFLKYSFSWYDSFIGTKVLGTFAPEERKFHGSECYTERKFLEPSLPRNENSTGVKVPRSECSMERKFHRSESSLYGLFAPGNESAEELKGLESSV